VSEDRAKYLADQIGQKSREAADAEPRPELAPIIPVNPIASVPSVYADLCVFATSSGSTVRITFAEAIVAPSDGPDPGLKVRHVGHLVLPREGFVNMLDYLNASRDLILGNKASGSPE